MAEIYKSQFSGQEIDERLELIPEIQEGVEAAQQAVDGKYTKPASGIPAEDIADDVIPDVSDFITNTVNDLVNYYRKSETYSRSEVQQLIAAIQGVSFVSVQTLPTASADTMGGKIYLVPSTNPDTQNVKDEFITVQDGSTYAWEQIGSTAIGLSGYVTTQQLNTALAAYTTTEALTALLAAKQDTISDLSSIRSGAAAGATAYQKPQTGIPASDLASGVIPTVPTDIVKYSSQSLTDAQQTQARTNIGAAAAAALTALETAIAAKYTKPSSGIPETDLASGVQSALALARTSIQSLAAYYTKTEIDALLAAVSSEQYVDVAALPTASASTLGKIYLVGPTNGVYDRYYTSYDGTTYSWVGVGTTEINLANYATKAELSQLSQDLERDVFGINETEYENVGQVAYYYDARLAAGWNGVGTYTPALVSDTKINQIVFPPFRASVEGAEAKYLIGYRQFSENGIKTPKTKLTILAEGVIEKVSSSSAYVRDFSITLPTEANIPAGNQIIILLYSASAKVYFLGGGVAATTVQPYNSEDARAFLLASAELTNPFESNWSISNDGGGTARYKVCNPVLKLFVKGAVDGLDEKVDGLADEVDGLDEKVDGLDEKVDNAVFEDAKDNLTEYNDLISGAFIRASNHTIEENQYTANYRIYLFRLPAGDYIFETTGESPSSVEVIGIINSVDDFRVGGVLSEAILAGSPATSVSRTFNEETLAVLLSPTPLNINNSGHIKRAYRKNRIDDVEEQVANIEEQITSSLKLTIPDTVYAVVGTELNIWNDAVSLSIDKGLSSPLNYQIRWRCNKGIITDRCFRFTPASGDVGDVSCTCFLYDMRGNLVDSKTFTIKVLSQNALQASKNIAYFGDSLGASAAVQLYSDFHDANKFGGVAPLMCGTRGTTPKYEAVGGYEWSDYATEGRTAYRASVTGVTSISLGAVYSDGAANFSVIEVNITDGIGNILLQSHYTRPGTLIMPSGTLTKVSGGGDDTVPYTNAFAESANPLWNDTTQELDVNQFKQMVGLQQSDKFDAVSFQLGVNEAARSNLDDILTHIDALYHCFVDDNPNCKFIIGLNTTSGNDVNGAGNNYGAFFNTVSYLDNSYKIRQLYLTLQNNADYPNIRIAPIGLEVDRYYGYAFSTRQISQRYTENEQYHNNYVHPGASGYGQMGDAYFAAYIGVLTES